MINDVVIIGGGASGLCCAVYLKQKCPDISVRILEGTSRVGKKLSLTGNGRCNITNKNIKLSSFHGTDKTFCEPALKKYNISFTENFFKSIGVPFVFEENKGYPASFQASSVVDCMRFAAEELGVIVNFETKVTGIQISKGKYKIIASNMNFLAENVVVAAGLLSGGDRLGCDASMLNLLKKSGFKTIMTTPAIVQLKTVNTVTKQLKGIKVNAEVTLMISGKPERKEYGEVLFCDYGLSGPPILQISREVSRTDKKCSVLLDILPDVTFEEACDLIKKRKTDLYYRNFDEFFTGMIHKRIGQVILKSCGIPLDCKVKELDSTSVKKIAAMLKGFEFEVTGTTGFSNSQVTAGGLATCGFNRNTMESLDNKGLYAVGEILDIDGDCGGFNLQWAWSSAFCAADSIIGDHI